MLKFDLSLPPNALHNKNMCGWIIKFKNVEENAVLKVMSLINFCRKKCSSLSQN